MICLCDPILVQGFEAYVGLLLLRTAFVGVASEWQVQVHFIYQNLNRNTLK